MTEQELSDLQASGLLTPLDLHFGRFMERLAGGDVPELILASALVSSAARQGHICLDLATVAGKVIAEGEGGEESVRCPDLSSWCARLGETHVVGKPGEYRPLLLDGDRRLYLYRYWEYQGRLAAAVRERVTRVDETVDGESIGEGLARLFPEEEPDGVNWQKVAAFTALTRRFSVISGGPGTGKTTTIARILALIVEQASPRPAVALAAPTGKAAARLQEAVREARERLPIAPETKAVLPQEASTLHRLLGVIPGSPYFRHTSKNPLPIDVLVVDEASMVDLALLSKAVQALPARARLILLGDRDQLASVEAGAALGDICDSAGEGPVSRSHAEELRRATGYRLDVDEGVDRPGIRDCIVHLRTSYRFGMSSGIGALCRAVNAGWSEEAAGLCREGFPDLGWRDVPPPERLPRAIREVVEEGFAQYLLTDDPGKSFQHLERFRILCAVREGPYGVVALNRAVEEILRGRGLIVSGRPWYRGRPVMITRNDYSLRLFNGDVGVVLPDPAAGGDLRVFFLSAEGTVRKFHPLLLPDHETVYAMTVHKSQGSEFDRVLLVLPDRESPVLTRELIYTGISRAREQAEIWGNEAVFRGAVTRRIERTSGLRDALTGT
ncbi:MAG TPA: exodeoxyribonuclease V subunit alpha [Syntrophobacteria bacterium]|nr:exodeoxyribonuclease V subunit alpha [Syntrophobacteria bacterium]